MSQTKAQLVDGFNINTSVPADSLVIDSSGNVGIGTTSPQQPLHIKNAGSSGCRLILENNGSSSATSTQVWSQNNDLVFDANGGEAVRIDSSRRLLVGTSSSLDVNAGLQIAVNSSFSDFYPLQIFHFDSTDNTQGPTTIYTRSKSDTIGTVSAINVDDGLGTILFRGAGTSAYVNGALIKAEVDTGTVSNTSMPGRLVFSTTADGASSPTERMRINSSGAFKVSNTGSYFANAFGHELVNNDSSVAILEAYHTSATTPYGYYFKSTAADPNNTTQYVFRADQNAGVNIYSIWSNGTTTARSDARYKKNIETTRNGYLEDLSQLRVVKYNWYNHEDDAPKELGFIAQEVEEVFPGLVMSEPEKDQEGNETGEVCKSIKFSVFTPMLVKALQEAMERIETLEAKVAALEAS